MATRRVVNARPPPQPPPTPAHSSSSHSSADVAAVEAFVAVSGDVKGLVTTLSSKLDAARLAKATSMLKADRFQLFADVSAVDVVGVVKSQTDSSLFYACRLASDGSFCCCTQNLNACGGLRGALCKHLLVLILGLSKAGKLDVTTATAWSLASTTQKPALVKDRMGEVFLRYQGVEAGTVDWRPTETLPEDFYAL